MQISATHHLSCHRLCLLYEEDTHTPTNNCLKNVNFLFVRKKNKQKVWKVLSLVLYLLQKNFPLVNRMLRTAFQLWSENSSTSSLIILKVTMLDFWKQTNKQKKISGLFWQGGNKSTCRCQFMCEKKRRQVFIPSKQFHRSQAVSLIPAWIVPNRPTTSTEQFSLPANKVATRHWSNELWDQGNGCDGLPQIPFFFVWFL